MPTLLLGVFVIAVAAVLALLSARLARVASNMADELDRPLLLPMASAAGLIAVAVLATGVERTLLWNRAEAEEIIIQLGHHGLSPGPLSARHDKPEAQGMGCLQSESSIEVESCTYGSTSPRKTVFLVGGSHSLQWLPALEEIAKVESWEIEIMTKIRCPFADPTDTKFFSVEGLSASCAAWNANVMEEILAARPDLVVTIATRKTSNPHNDDLGERIPEAYLANFAMLERADIPVVAIRDTPWLAEDVPACVFSVWNRNPDDCGLPRDQVLDDASVAIQADRMDETVAWVDMTDTVCDADHCGVVRDGKLIYRDSDHLTASYARSLAPLLAERIATSLRLTRATESAWP